MPSSARISISYLAKQLGVSPSTVSRALAGHHGISAAMSEQVRQLARELNYVPNQMAVGLKSGRHNTIAVIVPTVSRNFFATVIEGIEDYAYAAGFNVLICQSKDSSDRERSLLQSLNGKVDGIIASMAGDRGLHDYYNDLQVPLVLFDRSDRDIRASTVTINDFEGGRVATEHLLAQGYTKIYHFSGPQHVSIWADRCKGYRAAMQNAGIKICDTWIFEAYTTQNEGERFARELIERDDIPQAIFFSGDYAALGAMTEFKKAGLDIATVGFANEPFCTFIDKPLTSVNQHSLRMGKTACKALLDILAGEPSADIVIQPELIVRESSLRIRPE